MYFQTQPYVISHPGLGVDPRLPPEANFFFVGLPPHCSQNLGLELRRRFILLYRGNKERPECLTFLQKRPARRADSQMLLQFDPARKIELAIQIGVYEMMDFFTLHFTIP